ncbi:MAG: LysR family transcriptional regulator [Pigmentiphaga sp.]|nr:LysR family transcriptional regulator [Pigmentiphaga sp.]
MTPRQLKYFVAIARCGSITTAASHLHVAQPSLSQHIATLEEELGVPVFERHARGVTLTVEGQRLLERATSLLRQFERLRDDVRRAPDDIVGNVNLCLVDSIAPLLTVPLFRRLAEVAPRLTLHLSTGISREAHALVEARRVDIALLPTAFELPRLEVMPLFEEYFRVFGTAEWLAADTKRLRFADLASLPLAIPDRSHDLRKILERAALAQGVSLNVRYELNNAEVVSSVVSAGLACAIMPHNTFSAAVRERLIVHELIEPSLTRAQSLVWMTDHPLTPAGELVRNTLVHLTHQFIEDGTLQARRL